MPKQTDLISVRPLHQYLGAEIIGIDLTQPVSDAVFVQLRAAFDQYSVLVFRNQDIDDDQQVAFSRGFGQLETISFAIAAQNPYVYHLSNIDEHGNVLKRESGKRRFLEVNARWHTDSSFKPIPAHASILSGREIPQHERADTSFASMRVGYKTLDEQRQQSLHNLIGVHNYAYSLSQLGGTIPQSELDALPPAKHPLVRVHPGTGEPSLFVSGHIEAIEGLEPAMGRQLAEELIDWCTRPAFVYDHQWQTYDLVMWDNRCVLHRVTTIPETEVRRAHRTTVIGDGPVEPLPPPPT